MNQIEDTIIKLLLIRGPGKSICPSEIVRILYPNEWREKMKKVRTVAHKLVREGVIVITQKNRQVDIGSKGPIRLSLRE